MWRSLKQSENASVSQKTKVVENDGLDALMKALDDEKKIEEPCRIVRARRRSSPIQYNDEIFFSESISEEEKVAFAAIEKLRHELADPSVIEKANKKLEEKSSKKLFLDYYESKATELADYTIAQESSRNSYEINNCTLICDIKRDELRKFRKSQDGEFLLGLANQSIFADSIIALTEAIRPHNTIGAVVSNGDNGEAIYKLTSSVLEASIQLEISIPYIENTASKLVLCTVTAAIIISKQNTFWQLVRTLHRPILKHVFDDQAKRAARSMVKAQALGSDPVVGQSIIGAGRVLNAAVRGVDKLGQLVRRASSEEQSREGEI